MTDLTNPRAIKLKGALFLFLAVMASALLLIETPTWRHAMLLGMAIWGFCRSYYFAFYVIEHYVDSSFRFSGLGAFLRHFFGRRDSR